MKRMFMVMGLFVLLFTAARAQEKKFGMYAVGFYNQENLFDTIHDEGKNDFEYLPDGAMKWNGMKYFAKLKNMARYCRRWERTSCPMSVHLSSECLRLRIAV